MIAQLPQRPSAIMGIRDPLDALLMDMDMVVEIAKRMPSVTPEGKRRSTRDRILARRRKLGM